MENYKKNSSKLLSIIESENNKLVLYSVYDTFFNVNDNIYIIVVDDTKATPEYILLDSINTTMKYKVLKKIGNRITIDIKYDEFINNYKEIKNDNNVELLPPCYISRIYLTDSEIKSGVINSSLMENIKLQPITKTKIDWKQGIILKSDTEILNLNINPKNNDEYLILTLRYDKKTNKIEKFFTKNNKNYGLNFINIESEKYLNLTNCNINIGYYNKVLFNTSLYTTHKINNSVFFECNIDGSYIIDGGNFINSVLLSNYITWNNGIWNDNNNSFFKPQIWENGIWKNGTLSNITKWNDGIFENGIFRGYSWVSGTFNGGNFIDSTWNSGVFNGGLIENSTWNGGNFNSGTFKNSYWNGGEFNNGTMVNTNWINGKFNNGTFRNSIWENGIFNNGLFIDSTWNNGTFNNGTINNSDWKNGIFYNGIIDNGSIWENGRFYNGKVENSDWKNGIVYYGTFNRINWVNGEFYNGIMNNSSIDSINWYNGIANNSLFGYSSASVINWKNGSFNSGTFGYEYDIVSGTTTASEIYWLGGTFYSGYFYGKKWFDGIMYTCNNFDYNVVDSKFFLNKIFEPYKT